MDVKKICLGALKLSHKIQQKHNKTHGDEVHDERVTDISTRLDRIISTRLIDYFKKNRVPAVLYTEESGVIALSDKPDYSIAFDDLDGTFNFYRGKGNLPYGTIVTVFDSPKPEFGTARVAGMVEHTRNVLWLAEKGNGCTFNGKKCETSGAAELDRKTLVIIDHYMSNVDKFLKIYPKTWVKDFGMAGFHLAGVSNGMFDVFINEKQKAYELAAGRLFVEEAGGVVVDYAGNPIKPRDCSFDKYYPIIAAATQSIAQRIIGLI